MAAAAVEKVWDSLLEAIERIYQHPETVNKLRLFGMYT